MKKKQLLLKFVGQLKEGFSFGVKAEEVVEYYEAGKKKGADMRVVLNIKGNTVPVVIEIKDTQSIADLREAARKAKELGGASDCLPVVAGRFFGKRAREAMKEEGVGVMDLAGNLYLNAEDIYIERIVESNPFTKEMPTKDIFAPVSSRIVRAVLVEPERVWSIKKLSQETGASLGQTYKVIQAMLDREFIERVTTSSMWVSPHQDGKWQYREEGSESAAGLYDTQREAEKQAREVLQSRGGGELIIQGRDGKIRNKDIISK